MGAPVFVQRGQKLKVSIKVKDWTPEAGGNYNFLSCHLQCVSNPPGQPPPVGRVMAGPVAVTQPDQEVTFTLTVPADVWQMPAGLAIYYGPPLPAGEGPSPVKAVVIVQ